MRLEMLTPPALVGVRDPAGQVLPGLLIARRGERGFVQVSRGPGCNSLVWVAVDAVLAAEEAAAGAGLAPTPLVRAPSGRAPRGLR